MKPRKDSAERGDGNGCMARLVRFFMLLCIRRRSQVSYREPTAVTFEAPQHCAQNEDYALHRLLRTNPEEVQRRLLETCACERCHSSSPKWVCVALENTTMQGSSPSERMDIAKMKIALQMFSLQSLPQAMTRIPQYANLVPLAFLGITDGVPFGLEDEIETMMKTKPAPRPQVQKCQSEVVLGCYSFFLPNAQAMASADENTPPKESTL
jgi:hypothetical protein